MTLVLLVITVAARVIPALDCIAIIVRVQSRNCVFAYVNLFCIFRHLLSVRLYYVPYLRYRSIANNKVYLIIFMCLLVFAQNKIFD